MSHPEGGEMTQERMSDNEMLEYATTLEAERDELREAVRVLSASRTAAEQRGWNSRVRNIARDRKCSIETATTLLALIEAHDAIDARATYHTKGEER